MRNLTQEQIDQLAAEMMRTNDAINTIVGGSYNVAILMHKEHSGEEECHGTSILTDRDPGSMMMMLQQAAVMVMAGAGSVTASFQKTDGKTH